MEDAKLFMQHNCSFKQIMHEQIAICRGGKGGKFPVTACDRSLTGIHETHYSLPLLRLASLVWRQLPPQWFQPQIAPWGRQARLRQVGDHWPATSVGHCEVNRRSGKELTSHPWHIGLWSETTLDWKDLPYLINADKDESVLLLNCMQMQCKM